MKVVTRTYYVLDDTDRKSIKKQLIDLDLTLRQVAKNTGISVSYLSEVINGKKNFTEYIKQALEKQGIMLKKR